MKAALAAIGVVLAAARLSPGQEAEVEPIVVTGTFELNPRPSVTDRFTQHLLKQFETKLSFEEMVARSPWYYSKLWKYWPIPLGSSALDPDQFFKPQYLSLENQNLDQALRKSEKQSLFER